MKRDPFLIPGPALISFSGGRTSGYMLRRILDAGLQKDVHVVFADTGKERTQTYDFVRECSRRWHVPIFWVRRKGYFDQLIKDKGMLPNSLARFCTTELKLKPIWALGKALGWDHWEGVVGIRADEPRRVARIRGRPNMAFEYPYLPLVDAGITREDVMRFWTVQPFDLRLHPHESNCDLCFLKGQAKRIRIMQDHPELAQWWIDKEAETNGFFRASPRPNYAALLQIASQPRLFEFDDEADGIDCMCTD